MFWISEINLGINPDAYDISEEEDSQMKDVKPMSKDERKGWEILGWMFLGCSITMIALKLIFNF